MKGESKILYSAPVAEIISLNQEDVICTSWLPLAKFNLGKKSWHDQWLKEWDSISGLSGLDTEVE